MTRTISRERGIPILPARFIAPLRAGGRRAAPADGEPRGAMK
jgi:hypothetical protein